MARVKKMIEEFFYDSRNRRPVTKMSAGWQRIMDHSFFAKGNLLVLRRASKLNL